MPNRERSGMQGLAPVHDTCLARGEAQVDTTQRTGPAAHSLIPLGMCPLAHGWHLPGQSLISPTHLGSSITFQLPTPVGPEEENKVLAGMQWT